ncbi:MAG: PASTA domain-containing protein [Planctomycetota bacterium]
MRTIQVFGRIVGDDGKPVVNNAYTIQYYSLQPARWSTLLEVRTKDDGSFTASLRPSKEITGAAPLLRLVESGSPAPRVLASGGFCSYVTNSQLLRVDFGEVERLEETAYAQQSSTPVFRRSKQTIAGQAKRGEVSQAVVMRAMANVNPMVLGTVTDSSAARKRSDEAMHMVRATAGNTAQPALANVDVAKIQLELKRVSAREDALQKEVQEQEGTLRQKEQELGQLRSRLRVSEQQLSGLQQENAAIRKQVAEAKATPEDSVENRSFKVELARFSAREVQLATDLEKQRVVLAEQESTVSDLQNRLRTTEQKLRTTEQENQAIRAQVSTAQPIQQVAASIGGELHKANLNLKQQAQGYRLGRVQLNLRGVLSGDGTSISMPTAAELGDEKVQGKLQDIGFELMPEPEEDGDDQVPVPDVRGLTETAARRVLQSVGLHMESVTQAVSAQRQIPLGQAFLQSPQAGEPAPRRGNVLVTFAGRPLS